MNKIIELYYLVVRAKETLLKKGNIPEWVQVFISTDR
jgi:hypothetical protein